MPASTASAAGVTPCTHHYVNRQEACITVRVMKYLRDLDAAVAQKKTPEELLNSGGRFPNQKAGMILAHTCWDSFQSAVKNRHQSIEDIVATAVELAAVMMKVASDAQMAIPAVFDAAAGDAVLVAAGPADDAYSDADAEYDE